MFKNILSSDGRIRRTEYCLTYLGYILIVNGGTLVSAYFNFEYGDYLHIALIIPAFYILIVQGAKRCHDRGNSGWYQLIPFYQLWMFFADGDIFLDRLFRKIQHVRAKQRFAIFLVVVFMKI